MIIARSTKRHEGVLLLFLKWIRQNGTLALPCLCYDLVCPFRSNYTIDVGAQVQYMGVAHNSYIPLVGSGVK